MFQECKTDEDRKKLYRRLSKHLHPDCGGEADLMALLTRSYESSMSKSSFSAAMEAEEEEWDCVIRHESKNIYRSSDKIFLIDIILKYAKEHPKFKTDFVLSVKKWLSAHGFITAKQYNCLVDLFYDKKMNEWLERNK